MRHFDARTERGFVLIEVVFTVLIIAAISFGSLYAWHIHLSKNSRMVTKVPSFNTTNYTFPIEKITISYTKAWKITNASHTSNPCGNTDMLTMSDGGFYLNFNFGSICGKGSAPCFQEAGGSCTTESKNLALVQLSSMSKGYIIAYRSTTDKGVNWNYSIGLTSAPECISDFCIFIPQNIGAGTGGSTISGGYGLGEHPVNSLDEFIALSEVKDTVSVLKTAHY